MQLGCGGLAGGIEIEVGVQARDLEQPGDRRGGASHPQAMAGPRAWWSARSKTFSPAASEGHGAQIHHEIVATLGADVGELL